MVVAAAVSPATALPDRARPARADPHAELRRLVIARGPLRQALAAVAGRLVATRAWEQLGFARLRDYAVERAGHSARSLQDLARVDAALVGLPRVEAALVEGELTWTKAAAAPGGLQGWAALLGAGPHPASGAGDPLRAPAPLDRWACAVTVRRLQEDVEQALVLHETDPPRFEETGGLPAEQGATERGAVEEATASHIQERQDGENRQTGAKPTRTDETCRIFWNGPRAVRE